ncbi:MAG TPA: glycoside hydrolase [Firmicutes bacterium]|nr:glycoside hydrolase [Bacillota bacterium]
MPKIKATIGQKIEGSYTPMKIRIFCLLIISWSLMTAAAAYGAELQPGIIKGDNVNLRSGPGLDDHIISVLQPGLAVTVVDESAAWFMVQLPDGQTGWVYRQFIQTDGADSQENPPKFTVDMMLDYARSLLGIHYRYGGDSPRGFDCSGFIVYVLAKFGVNLPHEAALQMDTGEQVETREDLIPGDLVFFKTMGSRTVNHVGIYLGDNCFIHAASGFGAVRISPLDSGYYFSRYVGGRRLSMFIDAYKI